MLWSEDATNMGPTDSDALSMPDRVTATSMASASDRDGLEHGDDATISKRPLQKRPRSDRPRLEKNNIKRRGGAKHKNAYVKREKFRQAQYAAHAELYADADLEAPSVATSFGTSSAFGGGSGVQLAWPALVTAQPEAERGQSEDPRLRQPPRLPWTVAATGDFATQPWDSRVPDTQTWNRAPRWDSEVPEAPNWTTTWPATVRMPPPPPPTTPRPPPTQAPTQAPTPPTGCNEDDEMVDMLADAGDDVLEGSPPGDGGVCLSPFKSTIPSSSANALPPPNPPPKPPKLDSDERQSSQWLGCRSQTWPRHAHLAEDHVASPATRAWYKAVVAGAVVPSFFYEPAAYEALAAYVSAVCTHAPSSVGSDVPVVLEEGMRVAVAMHGGKDRWFAVGAYLRRAPAAALHSGESTEGLFAFTPDSIIHTSCLSKGVRLLNYSAQRKAFLNGINNFDPTNVRDDYAVYAIPSVYEPSVPESVAALDGGFTTDGEAVAAALRRSSRLRHSVDRLDPSAAAVAAAAAAAAASVHESQIILVLVDPKYDGNEVWLPARTVRGRYPYKFEAVVGGDDTWREWYKSNASPTSATARSSTSCSPTASSATRCSS